MKDRIHIENLKLYSGTWCDDGHATLTTDLVKLATCIKCLEKLADHHRIEAVSATARICEVVE